LIAWLATRTDKTATCRLTRIDWHMIGRIIECVGDELFDGDRLSDLFEISINEVAWRKGHRYLTLVGDHRTGRAGRLERGSRRGVGSDSSSSGRVTSRTRRCGRPAISCPELCPELP